MLLQSHAGLLLREPPRLWSASPLCATCLPLPDLTCAQPVDTPPPLVPVQSLEGKIVASSSRRGADRLPRPRRRDVRT